MIFPVCKQLVQPPDISFAFIYSRLWVGCCVCVVVSIFSFEVIILLLLVFNPFAHYIFFMI